MSDIEDEVKCSECPNASHGFDRNASHNAGRYVCQCESHKCTAESLRRELAEARQEIADRKDYYEQVMQDGGDRIKKLLQQLKHMTDEYHAALDAEQVRYRQVVEKDAEIERLNKPCQIPVPSDVAVLIERTDWTPEQALQFYADQRNFDIVEGRARIIDNGAVASNALKHLTLDRLELKGDAELTELRQQLSAAQAREQQLLDLLPARTPGGFVSFGKNYAEAEDKFNDPRNPMCRFKRIYLDACEQALALPQDTIALEAMIAKAGEVMRERCAVRADWFTPFVGGKIRALPGVTLEDIK